MERSTPEKASSPSRSGQLAKNWLSVEANIAGAGLRYEGMLNDYFSLGGNAFFQTYGIAWLNFGVDFTTRVYPFKKILYIGMGLGFHGYGSWYYEYFRYELAFGMSPEIGVKIPFGGKQRGFFMDIGYKNPLLIGQGFHFNTVPHIGFGGAF